MTPSCSVSVMLNLFLIMMRHMLDIVGGYKDFLVDDWWCIMAAVGNRFLIYESSKGILGSLSLNSQLEGHGGGR